MMPTTPGDSPAPASRPSSGRPGGATRRGSLLRDRVGTVWLAGAVIVALTHQWVPGATWLMIHLVLLGALTHSAMVWSEHFATTLLRVADTPERRAAQNRRLALLAAGALAVFVGVPSTWWWLTVAGATAVAVAVIWHGVQLGVELRRALPNRFRITIHYYLAAAACLPVGAVFGAALAWGLPDEWHGRLLIAHTMTNLLGWIGLTVTGTLVTLWPTMLRTRMDDRAERLAREALPMLLIGVALLAAGGLVGLRWVALLGLVDYLLALLWWGRALLRPLKAKPPREFASASVLAALGWAVVALAWVGWVLATASSWPEVTNAFPRVAGVFAVGFAAQLLTGALSYLMPSVMGGGPSVVRAGQEWFDKGATLRLGVINGGLLLWALPTPSWVKVTTSVVVLAALAAFIPLMLRGVRASVAARRALLAKAESAKAESAKAESADAPPRRREVTPHRASIWSGGQLVAALTALVLAVTVGVGVDPAAAGLPASLTGQQASAGVAATGQTTRVEVRAIGMSFEPSSVDVPAGNRLVVVLTNADSTTAHDLAIGSTKTPRLAPGETVELDAGVMSSSIQGWCTVPGHRQMGMVFDVNVTGAPTGAAAAAPTASGASNAADHSAHGAPAGPAASLSRTIDPALPPLTNEKVRKVTLKVTEVPLEVAPGVWQKRWTFGGAGVGPTLHGRVGDVFEVTLVNDGTIGHSIDFHAGALAPDQPMRTIESGESLVYRFTANRAGIWMYHCSTAPMSSHIAAGMHGAVVIEPPNLPRVDRSYVLVQSEVYLGAATGQADAAEVNAEKVVAETPDRVVFNGIANQYDQQPFAAKVGERVRFWVLDAGPSRASSFHIVGGQFDTVYLEGAYRLRNGRGAFGESGGGSQALGLQPAQGGFVELTFPEAGHYPVVSHIMVDAERGAHGVVRVTR